MCICCYKRNTIATKIEVNTRHCRAKVFCSSGKSSFAYTCAKNSSIHCAFEVIVFQCWSLWILVTILSDKVIITCFCAEYNSQVFWVNIEAKWLFWEFFERIHQKFCRQCNCYITLLIINFKRSCKCCFEV